MNLSHIPTDYIIVRAQTNSDWDNCSFAIITISLEWRKEQAKRIRFFKAFENCNTFYAAQFFNAEIQFFDADYGLSEIVEGFEQQMGWCFLEATQNEIAHLHTPQSTIGTSCICIDAFGNGTYKGWADYSSEEFFTDQFSIEEILKAYENN
ncbi:hypothetical protein [Sphingobacterium sp. UBA5670]|uniref:hypothetical protein n=1 Tax=Sphingobacterium sp. UBA5670 TaxID=1947502 RepID=UPI0025F1EDB8|nr:hypothetical protein [Sphingobacterium sp. UBA5670]